MNPEWKIALYALFAAMILIGMIQMAFGHEAPSGMPYDGWCCNEDDCGPIPFEDVTENPDGSVTYRHCTFYQQERLPGLRPGKGYLRQSTDGEWHACIQPVWGENPTIDGGGGPQVNNGQCRCLYQPLRGF